VEQATLDLAERRLGRVDRGILAWRHALPAILIDSPSQISHELLKRIVSTQGSGAPAYERVELPNPDKLEFDRVDEHATHELTLLGSTEAASLAMRSRLSSYFRPSTAQV